MRPHLLLLILLMCQAAFAAPSTAVKGGTVLADYESALSAFNQGKAGQARVRFEALLKRDDLPDDLRDNCSFWLGEAHYSQKSWLDALSCFLKVLEHPDSNKEEDARLKIALCWEQMHDQARACAEARTLLARFPDGASAPRARRLLGSCQPGR